MWKPELEAHENKANIVENLIYLQSFNVLGLPQAMSFKPRHLLVLVQEPLF